MWAWGEWLDLHFTFHDVSINTACFRFLLWLTSSFTFHDVSINTRSFRASTCCFPPTLHSTMFLLILYPFSSVPVLLTSLHSTMFLLIRENRWQNCILTNFTFHDVSINTLQLLSLMFSQFSLHSTMFLLIQGCKYLTPFENDFTFHDVSINTVRSLLIPILIQALHSTMFLLIRLNSWLS